MKIETYPLGNAMANCYVVYKNNHALIIDPGTSSRKIVEHIKTEGVHVDAILLTHGHFDHIGGVDFFAEAFECPVYISEDEKEFLIDSTLNGSSSMSKDKVQVKHAVKFYSPSMSIHDFHFEVKELPGHTNGSCLLLFDEKIAFSGDILFKQSIGRYDLPTGSMNKTKATIEKLKQLSPDIIVYPGHGEPTTIQDELLYNPYF